MQLRSPKLKTYLIASMLINIMLNIYYVIRGLEMREDRMDFNMSLFAV